MMFPLDPKTVERIAKIVVDPGGPYERTGRELEGLLRNAGWSDPPEYDGSFKIGWLVEALCEREQARADIERFLCRISDPIEYADGAAAADEVRRAVNQVLALERLEVNYVGSRPVVGEVGQTGTARVVLHVEDVEERLRKLVLEEELVQLLVSRVRQSQLSEASGSYLLAIFGIGSFVEGLLYSVLLRHHPELARDGFIGRNGKIRADRAGLELLIETAHSQGLIQLDAKDFMYPIREFRNYIHPRRQLESKFTPDADTVAMCWGPLQALLNDLDAFGEPRMAEGATA